MKKLICLIIGVVCFSSSCKKNPFDYRTKYLGDYKFSIHYSSWNPLDGEVDTTYSIDGKIDYASDNKMISIFFSGRSSAQLFKIDEDGTIEAENGHEGGSFETVNSVKYSGYWASPGAHTFETVNGNKK